jgi:polysaccharide export outer membrane protein
LTRSTGGFDAGARRSSGSGRERLWLSALRVGLAVLLASACQHAPPAAEPANGPPPAYRLGSGDRVRVTIFEHPDLSGEFEVDSSGRLALPLIRGVSALGLSLPGLEDAIAERLTGERIVNPKVSVDLVKSRPVCVLGEVVKPGCFDYYYGMRVSSALAMAGGYTYRARKNTVDITRESGEVIAGSHQTLVFPGDTVEVKDRVF